MTVSITLIDGVKSWCGFEPRLGQDQSSRTAAFPTGCLWTVPNIVSRPDVYPHGPLLLLRTALTPHETVLARGHVECTYTLYLGMQSKEAVHLPEATCNLHPLCCAMDKAGKYSPRISEQETTINIRCVFRMGKAFRAGVQPLCYLKHWAGVFT